MNTDSGYHGLSEDDMDVDRVLLLVDPIDGEDRVVEISPGSPLAGQPTAINQLEGRSTTETSFHTAREETTRRDVISGALQEEQSAQSNPCASPMSTTLEPANSARLGSQNKEDVEMDLVLAEKDFDENPAANQLYSPSQGSSPARPIVRKSSLTFAALPAREPLTTKKSLGASRGSFLGRLTGGKSLGGSKQPEPAYEKDVDDEVWIDTDKPTLYREESDGDSKITKLHNKSSTQRLHERINMLGKSQNTRPTKSISASATAPNSIYPQLPIHEPQIQIQVPHRISVLPKKALAVAEINDEDDDDWIQPPLSQLSTSSRPQPLTIVSADVMEDLRGKQTVACHEVSLDQHHQRTKGTSPLPQPFPAQSHGSESTTEAVNSESRSPLCTHARSGVGIGTFRAPDQWINPTGSPYSQRYVDGPLSASKSKLQSIMKTARGLFSSSAGVSAQAKMETLSTSLQSQDEPQGPPKDRLHNNETSGNGVSTRTPIIHHADRKTRSSTEKEERKRSEAKERERAEVQAKGVREQQEQETVVSKQIQIYDQSVNIAPLPIKSTRQSPRKTQNQNASNPLIDAGNGETLSQPMGPPQQSQSQRSKDPRRPVRPAKEAGPKPKPQPVAIRVGTLSQGMRLNNAALSSNLQESLPSSQSKQSAAAKKPSNASVQSATSNSSLKNSVSSVSTKPKALIAAERKKEQVSHTNTSKSW